MSKFKSAFEPLPWELGIAGVSGHQDYTKALELLADWLNHHPQDDRAYYQQALLFHQQSQGPDAIRSILQVFPLQPSEERYYDLLAELLQAYRIFKPAWCRNLGNFYHQQGQLQKAMFWYCQGQHIDPENPGWSQLIGPLAYQLGQIELALQCFNQLQHSTPEEPNVFYNLGSLYFMTEEFRLSWQYFLRAYWLKTKQDERFDLEPIPPNHMLATFHDYLLSCAMSHFLNGKAISSQQLCQKILQENPDHPEVLPLSTALGLLLD